jgi:hypothetical protein
MSAILAYVDLTLVGYVAVFVVTLVFSQKIKDYFSGVPAELRTGMSSLEAKAKSDLRAAAAGVIAKYTSASAPAPAPVAPVAPAPAAPPAA